MRHSARSEAVAMLRGVVAALLSEPFNAATPAGAELRRACGDVHANAEAYVRAAGFGAPLAACFTAALSAGMPADSFMRVRLSVAAMWQSYAVSRVVSVLAVRLALAGECSALAGVTVASRQQVDGYISRLRPAFEASLDYAMDSADGEAFKVLSTLYAAVVRDLTERGRQLPRMSSYDTWRPLPSLALAHRLYADADRAGELVDENRTPNPIFMSATGRALAR